MMDSGFLAKTVSSKQAQASQEPDAFVYFVDPVELAKLQPGWPDQMRLLICMDASGLCEFVVFHNEEESTVFDRVADILDRPIGSFAVSPLVDGHPTRGLLFSEENALLKAIRHSKSLEETAADYLINYDFAREEGLDFDELMRPRLDVEEDRTSRVNTGKVFRIGPRKRRKLRAGPPEGYVPSSDMKSGDCHYISLQMWVNGGRMRIARNPDKPLLMVPTLARDIAFRDDFASVYIPRDILAPDWTPKDDILIDIPVELFPAGFSDGCQRREVKTCVMPRGIFVEFGARIDVPEVPEPELLEPTGFAPQQPARGQRLWKNLHIPVIAVLGLGITGFFSAIIAQTTGSNSSADHATAPIVLERTAQAQP